MQKGESRKIAAILAADVVGYTRLVGADEAAALTALKLRREIFERLVGEFGGREFGSVGDSLMAQFPSALNAVRCARHLQHAIAEENDTAPAERRMELRIGIDLGDMVEQDGLLYGDGVNVAARLQAMASPGGIIVSGAVYEQVKNKLSANFNSLGARPLKNIAEPIVCYEVTEPVGMRSNQSVAPWLRRRGVGLTLVVSLLILGGGVIWYYQNTRNMPVATPIRATGPPARAATATAQSIAVLPFADMSADKNQEYMADGMAEELLNLLTQVPDLKVIARTSSFAFKGQNIDVSEIAKKLNVAHVLEGSVRTSGNKLRITAQLVRASDSTHLWSQTYDRPLNDIFALQTEIANAIVQALQIKLMGGTLTRREGGTENLEAYELYLRALRAVNENTRASLDAATNYAEQAIKLDPKFGKGTNLLAIIHLVMADNGFVSSSEGYEKARKLVQHALELSPNLAEAHAILASVYFAFDWNWAAANAEVNQALAIDPSDPFTLNEAGRLSTTLGDWDEAIGRFIKAQLRDPLDPWVMWNLADAHYRAGNLVEAEATFHKVLELKPGFAWTHLYLGKTLLVQGKVHEALAQVLQEPDRDLQLVFLPVMLYAAGRISESDEALAAQAKEWGETGAYEVAQTHAYRGEHDLALQWLERAYIQKDSGLIEIVGEHLFKNIADDPRFKAFLRKMNLPQDSKLIDHRQSSQ